MAYLNKGIALEHEGKIEDAVSLYDQCCALNERLVLEENRRTFTGEWAKAQLYAADGYLQLGDVDHARELAGPALQMLEDEILRTQSERALHHAQLGAETVAHGALI